MKRRKKSEAGGLQDKLLCTTTHTDAESLACVVLFQKILWMMMCAVFYTRSLLLRGYDSLFFMLQPHQLHTSELSEVNQRKREEK